MAQSQETKKGIAPYAPFKTFLSALETLEHGLPPSIDRSVWPTFSGVIQSQILATFRFLGLIQADGTPTPGLKKLVEEPATRKALLRKILEVSYPEVVAGGLTKMSMGNLETAFRQYSVTGATFRKAVSFFLQAARYAELPLSPYIMKKTRAVSTRRRKAVSVRGKQEGNGYTHAHDAGNGTPPQSSGPVKTILLKLGITLSLSANADTFKMDGDDREFVIKLLDEMEAYETGLKISEAEK